MSSLIGICKCTHSGTAHEHYRKGTDCGICDCTSYDRILDLRQPDVPVEASSLAQR